MNRTLFSIATVVLYLFVGKALAFELANLSGVKQVATGHSHTCALLDNGSVWCWGDNQFGQLGDGTNKRMRSIASAVVGLPPAKAIAAGYNHTCALTTNDWIYCWGAAAFGQLGTVVPRGATFVNTPSGVPNNGDGTYSAVSARGNTTCALDGRSVAWCWGENGEGQVGDGTKLDRRFPTAVNGGTLTPSQIAIGFQQTCAIVSFRIMCWGTGYYGSFVYDTATIPNGVTDFSNVLQISVGYDELCALEGDASLWCLGDNSEGQFGDGTVNDHWTPSRVGGPMYTPSFQSVSVGSAHTCAVMIGNYVRCWGANYHAQIGDGTRNRALWPTPVDLPSVREVSASEGQHTCAATYDGKAYCWGLNDSGQAGIGAYGADVVIPVAVLDDDRVFADGVDPSVIGGI